MRALGWALHHLGQIVVALVMLVATGVLALSWRLSQGPISLDWAARRLETQVSAEHRGTHLSIGRAALAWEGFHDGVAAPLDLRLTAIRATDAGGQRLVDVPRADLSVALAPLFLGRLEPRSLRIDGPELRVVRGTDGAISLDLGALPQMAADAVPGGTTTGTDLPGVLKDLASPAPTDQRSTAPRALGQLRRVRITGAVLTIVDRRLGVVWHLPEAEIDLRRQRAGGVSGNARAQLAVGQQRVTLTATAELQPGGRATHVTAHLSPVNPADLAGAAPSLAPMAALDAKLGGTAEFDLGPQLGLVHGSLALDLGPGVARIGPSAVPILDGALATEGDAQGVTLTRLRLHFPSQVQPGQPPGPGTVLQVQGRATRQAGRVAANLTLDLDQLTFADLPALWPEGVGGPGTRPWLTQNVTAGTMHDGHVELTLDAPEDLSDANLTRATGTLLADDVTVHWLRPVPPIEHVQARLRILDPDTIEIATTGGRQSPGALTSPDGNLRLTGLAGRHQIALIDAQLAGPVPDTVTLLHHPRLHLFDRHPLDLKNPTGQAAARLTVRLPLEADVDMDAIAIRAQGKLSQAHLSDVVAGHALDQGQFDLDVTNDGLKASGHALVAAIPAQIGIAMDFRSGPPAQAVQKITVAGHADRAQMEAAGYASAGTLTEGAIGLQATLTEHRDGRGEVVAAADLTDAALALSLVRWSKAAGGPASAHATVLLKQDHLVGIDALSIEGPGLSVHGTAALAAGQAHTLTLDRIELGRTRAHGEVAFPPVAGPDAAITEAAPIRIRIAGPLMDLSARLSHAPPAAAADTPAKPPPARLSNAADPGPPLTLDAQFDQALMGDGQSFTGVKAHAERAGGVIRRAAFDATTGARQPIHLTIAPEAAGRRLVAHAGDAGGLLRALDVSATIIGGTLGVSARFDDTAPDHPLSGTARLDNFSIRGAPALGKMLQAMTLYGVVDALSGPGLLFTRMVAPFRLTDTALDLNSARAFSASLGVTAKGRVDFGGGTADLQGTIVPAYFFNSLLGRLPVIGRLFSPEQGGGLFAATYAVRGPLDDPQVSVNPLAALTPGALRGLFETTDAAPGAPQR